MKGGHLLWDLLRYGGPLQDLSIILSRSDRNCFHWKWFHCALLHIPSLINLCAVLPNHPCSFHARPVSIRCCHAATFSSVVSASSKPSAIAIALWLFNLFYPPMNPVYFIACIGVLSICFVFALVSQLYVVLFQASKKILIFDSLYFLKSHVYSPSGTNWTVASSETATTMATVSVFSSVCVAIFAKQSNSTGIAIYGLCKGFFIVFSYCSGSSKVFNNMFIVFSATIFDRWSASGLSSTLHASAKMVCRARFSANVDCRGIGASCAVVFMFILLLDSGFVRFGHLISGDKIDVE